MISPKNVLVTTTTLLEGLEIKQYLKPVTAHIVVGAGMFSDFIASFTDVFGGRSQGYQKRLISLYNEAIESLKIAAFELGGNCIIALKIDFDEISGKGKEMFMINAIGTACIIEDNEKKINNLEGSEKFENVGLDRMITLNNKRHIIAKANSGDLLLNEEEWSFITSNQVDELFPYLLAKFQQINNPQLYQMDIKEFYKHLLSYMEALSETKKVELLYNSIANENDEELVFRLCDIIKELHLLDLDKVEGLLKLTEFQKQKRGLRILIYDKSFYNNDDIKKLTAIKEYIASTFTERGTKTMKKQMLSSKEKEAWTCECGKTNLIEDTYCQNQICAKDIYGFKANEVSPKKAILNIENKISLISAFVQ